MPETLLNPDNRLLNWSINDLGLYGAALTPATISAAEQRREYATQDDTRPVHASDPTPLVGGAGVDPASSGATTADTLSFAQDGLASAPPAFQPMMLPTPAMSAPAMATLPLGAPADLGSGSTTGIFVPAPVPPPTAPTLISDTPIDTAGTLSAPVLATGPALDGTTLTTTTVVEQVGASLADTIATIDDTTTAATEATASVAQAAVDDVQAIADTTASATANLVGAAQDAATSTLAAASDTLNATATTVDSVITPAVAPVVDALAATATATEAATTASTDLLAGVGGTDPAAGVATLVGIVATADEFDLSHVDAAPVTDTGSIVDLLAVDLNDAPLLGVGDDGHDADDDAHGLFGL